MSGPCDYRGKRIALIRGGHGIGDMLQCTPVVRRLKEAGAAHVTVWCHPSTEPIMRHNPFVDAISYFDPAIDDQKLTVAERVAAAKAQDEKLAAEGDHIISLALTVESEFVFKTAIYDAVGKPEGFTLPLLSERREKAKDINLYEEMIKAAGLELQHGDRCLPELYFDEEEEVAFAAFAVKKKKMQRWVLWNPTGSSLNKNLPWTARLIKAALERYPDSHHFMVGSISCEIKDPRVSVIGMAWPLRVLFSFMRAMDLVVAPDSAVLNAAGCFSKVRKLGYFTHSYPGHILKHFDRADAVQSKCDCSPCLLLPVDYSDQWDHPAFRQNARVFYKHCVQMSPHDMYQPVGYKCTMGFDESEFIHKVLKALK